MGAQGPRFTALVSVAGVAPRHRRVTISSDRKANQPRFRGFGANVPLTKTSGALTPAECRSRQNSRQQGESPARAYAVASRRRRREGSCRRRDPLDAAQAGTSWVFRRMDIQGVQSLARVCRIAFPHGGSWQSHTATPISPSRRCSLSVAGPTMTARYISSRRLRGPDRRSTHNRSVRVEGRLGQSSHNVPDEALPGPMLK